MNGAHWHLILNHLPVLGSAFGLLLLLFALWRRSTEMAKAAWGILVIGALAATAAYLTGEPAEKILRNFPGFAGVLVERHEDAAGIALGSSVGLGVMALASLVWFRGVKPKNWANAVLLVGAIVVTGLMAWTAFLGGHIRHPEIQTHQPAVLTLSHQAQRL